MTADEKRAAYISGLRKLADLLEENAELPAPTHGAHEYIPVRWVISSDAAEGQRETLAALARALPGRSTKHATDNHFFLKARLDGLHVEVLASRDEVCERVVTGTREVTKTVPDPAVQVPMVEVTETVEDVEWVCAPLLQESPR